MPTPAVPRPDIALFATWASLSRDEVTALGPGELDIDERTRALALRSDAARGRFVVRRLRLRDELACLTGIRHEDIRYRREPCTACGGPHGRPRAIGYDGYFSTSSTPSVTALAFADAPVGIDVETLVPSDRVQDVAGLLHPAEQAAIEAASRVGSDDARRTFTQIWTRKEALLKATGEGLNAPLDRDDVSDPGRGPAGWRIVDISDDLAGFDGPPTLGAWALRQPSCRA